MRVAVRNRSANEIFYHGGRGGHGEIKTGGTRADSSRRSRRFAPRAARNDKFWNHDFFRSLIKLCPGRADLSFEIVLLASARNRASLPSHHEMRTESRVAN